MRRNWWALPAVLCLLLMGIQPLAASPPQMQLVLASPTQSVLGLPERVAVHLGFFKKYGLDVLLQPETRSMSSATAVQLGHAQIANAEAMEALLANASGEHLVEIASNGAGAGHIVLSRVPLHALAGGRFATSRPFTADMAAAVIALQRLGVDPHTMLWVLDREPRQRMRAFAAGGVDAIVVSPYEVAKCDLATLHPSVIYDLRAEHVPFVTRDYVTRLRYHSQHREEIRAFLKGLIEANAYLLSPGNRETVIALLKDPETTNLDDPQAEAAYEDLTRNVIHRVPATDRQGLETLLAAGHAFYPRYWWFDPHLWEFNVSRYMHEEILRDLEDSGFPEQMCRVHPCQ